MASAITSFNFENTAEVRAFERDGVLWWVLADICQVLDHTNSRMAADRLDNDEKGVSIVYTPGGPQEMTVINESGLWSLVLTSRKPAAKRFKKWITSDVIPTIRRTGHYGDASGLNCNVIDAFRSAIAERRILTGMKDRDTVHFANSEIRAKFGIDVLETIGVNPPLSRTSVANSLETGKIGLVINALSEHFEIDGDSFTIKQIMSKAGRSDKLREILMEKTSSIGGFLDRRNVTNLLNAYALRIVDGLYIKPIEARHTATTWRIARRRQEAGETVKAIS